MYNMGQYMVPENEILRGMVQLDVEWDERRLDNNALKRN